MKPGGDLCVFIGQHPYSDDENAHLGQSFVPDGIEGRLPEQTVLRVQNDGLSKLVDLNHGLQALQINSQSMAVQGILYDESRYAWIFVT